MNVRWLASPPVFVRVEDAVWPEAVNGWHTDPADLAKRTLTNLYNQRPTWLANAHADLDAAAVAAYGWPADLTGTEILERLLALNLGRADP